MKGKRYTTEDPNGENVAMDPDDYLPWPHPALVQKWWQASEAKFPKGVRHLNRVSSNGWNRSCIKGVNTSARRRGLN
jgi:hypothetical protein